MKIRFCRQIIWVLVFFMLIVGCDIRENYFEQATKRYLENDLTGASDLYLKSVDDFQSQKPVNHFMLGKTYNRLGSIHAATNQSDPAVRYFLLAAEEFREAKPVDHVEAGKSLNSLGLYLRNKGRLAEATQYLRMSVSEFEKGENNKLLAASLVGLGSAYSELGDGNTAFESLTRAKILYERLELKKQIDRVDALIEKLISADEERP